MNFIRGTGFVFIIFGLIAACEKEPFSDIIYFNSFESNWDTIGWEGSVDFYYDAPPHGGNRSIHISGGCVIPHAYFYLGPFTEDYELSLMCYGKDLMRGGGILMITEDLGSNAHVTINDPEWTLYSTDETVFCPAGKRVRIELMSGGFISSAMLVDKLSVIRK